MPKPDCVTSKLSKGLLMIDDFCPMPTIRMVQQKVSPMRMVLTAFTTALVLSLKPA